MIITNSRYALVGYFITSYPTRANGIIVNYHPTALRRVQITAKNEYKYHAVFVLQIRPRGHNNLACNGKKSLISVLLCSIDENFYS